MSILCNISTSFPTNLYLQFLEDLFNSKEWGSVPVHHQYGRLHLACNIPEGISTSVYENIFSHPEWNTISNKGPYSIGQLAYTFLDKHPDMFEKISHHPQFTKIPAVEKFPYYGLIQLANQALLKRNESAIETLSKSPEWENIPPSFLYELAKKAITTSLASSFFIFSKHPCFKKITPIQLIELISCTHAIELPQVFSIITQHPNWNFVSPTGPLSLHTLLQHDLAKYPDMLNSILKHPNSIQIPVSCILTLKNLSKIFYDFIGHEHFNDLPPDTLVQLLLHVDSNNLLSILPKISNHPSWRKIPPKGRCSLQTLLESNTEHEAELLKEILKHPHWTSIPIQLLRDKRLKHRFSIYELENHL